MKAVKTIQRYKCDFCKKRSVRSVIALHEKRCFRNPNRFCDSCENKGYTEVTVLEGYPVQKEDCRYCSSFDEKKLAEIRERELKENK